MTRRVLALAITTALILAIFGLAAGTRAQDEPNDLDDLQATAEAHETEIANLEATAEANSEEIAAQQTVIAELEATVDAHADDVEAQQTQIADLEATADAQQDEIDALQAQLDAGQDTLQATPVTDDPAGATPGSEVVLYEADATGGLDEWTEGSPEWLHRDGELVNDGTARGSLILAPYQPSTSDYAVEAEIRLVRCDSAGLSGGSWGLVARAEEQGAYRAGYNCITENSDNASIWAWDIAGAEATILVEEQSESEVDEEWHTFRLEVEGDAIRLFVDGALLAETGDVRYVDGTQVGLWSSSAAIVVRSFRVLGL